MIPLVKGAKPQILADNEDIWTATLVNKLAAGEEPTATEKTRYRNPQIKSALVSETNGKCAYCESKLLHIHHGDVEHIFPKSLEPAISFKWENLTLACEICNQNKSNKDPYFEHIIDPYGANPADHILFVGPLLFTLGSVAGTNTRSLLDLNRPELAERRKEHLERIMGIIDTVFRADIPIATRAAIYADLHARETTASAQYSAMVGSAVNQISPLLPAEIVHPS